MKNKIKQRLMGAVTIAAAFFVGISPMTAFAQSKPECTCETKCTEDCVDPDCEMCQEDIANCEGTEPEPVEETFGPLTPDGNLSLVDDYGSIEAGGKQFITVVTKKGNYFYIIIDRDDQGDETVHFLNMVDESDLLSLMDDEEAQAYVDAMTVNPEASTETVEEESTEESTETEPVVTEEKPKQDSKTGLMALILLGTVAGIGGFLYLKNAKKKPVKTVGPDPDADYVDDEEDYLAGLAEDDDFEDEEMADDFEEDSMDPEEE